MCTLLLDSRRQTTPWSKLPSETTPYRKYFGDNSLWVLTLTDPRRGVLSLTLTLTLTDPRGGNYLKTGTNPHS